jgi:glycosyltransferase involved in cell wall biosynthesis
MKVLQVSTHATLKPRYGGPLRSHQMAVSLENAGFEVGRLAVCWQMEHDVSDAREPIVDVKRSPWWSSPSGRRVEPVLPFFMDYYFASAVAEAPELRNMFVDRAAAVAPEVIILQHPWMWPLVKGLPGVRAGAIRVVYSSHNVEAQLKRGMVKDAAVNIPPDYFTAVDTLERDLVTSSWATVACTHADANIFRSWGANNVVVANNGAALKSRDNLRGALPAPLAPDHRFALFIGSNYLPNTSGFFKYIAPALPRLQLARRIVVAGTVCDAINAQVSELPLRQYQDGRLVCLGFVDDLALDALIENAAAVLLPIEYGGGSHLKTAEALASGRPIIGTTASFRGFSEYAGLSRVTIADSPEQFEAAIHASLAVPERHYGDSSPPWDVTWEATLDPFVQLMQTMAPDIAPASRELVCQI